jgi:hypothetical protein
MTEDVWGITRKMDEIHFFRNGRKLCPGHSQRHGWLFIARPNWQPYFPNTCKFCLKILELEQLEQSLVSQQSPFSLTS